MAELSARPDLEAAVMARQAVDPAATEVVVCETFDPIRAILGRQLKFVGLPSLEFANGEEFLATRGEGYSPLAIISNQKNFGDAMDGLDFAKALRASGDVATPFIILTGGDTREILEDRSGAVDVVAEKPINYNELAAAIKNAIAVRLLKVEAMAGQSGTSEEV